MSRKEGNYVRKYIFLFSPPIRHTHQGENITSLTNGTGKEEKMMEKYYNQNRKNKKKQEIG